jgi:hypothetical protein
MAIRQVKHLTAIKKYVIILIGIKKEEKPITAGANPN